METIFKREKELKAISDFLSSDKKILLVKGPSGVGKTTLINQVLHHNNNQRILDYQFGAVNGIKEDDRFPQFIFDSFLKSRKSYVIDKLFRKNGLKVESASLGFSFFRLAGASFRIKPFDLKSNIDVEYVMPTIIDSLESSFSILRFQDFENYSSERNVFLLFEICKEIYKRSLLKIIIECEEVNLFNNQLRTIPEYNSFVEEISVENLNKKDAIDFFQRIHKIHAPESLYEDTDGNPLMIEYYGKPILYLSSRNDILTQKIRDVTPKSEIILCCITAFGKEVNIDLLESASFLEKDFGTSLIELKRKKLIEFYGDNITFSHQIIKGILQSEEFKSSVRFFGRKNIIKYIERKSEKTHEDNLELARQYYLMGDIEKSASCALEYAYQNYVNQNFNKIFDCEFYLEISKNSSIKKKSNILLLQMGIRMGDIDSAEKYLYRIQSEDDKIISLLRVQTCYLANKFEEGIELVQNIAKDLTNENYLLGRALGIKTACLIALGNQREARNTYSESLSISRRHNDEELKMELLRLSPELDLDFTFQQNYNELESSSYREKFPYLSWKCYHNYTVHEIFANGNKRKDLIETLLKSAAFFEIEKYPEYSYSAICLSAWYIINNNYDEAGKILDSSKAFLHEQYDRFCWNLNKGLVFFCKNDYRKAQELFLVAREELENGDHPLNDPYFHYILNYNYTITLMALSENKDQILNKLKKITIPENCFSPSAKEERMKRLMDLYDFPEKFNIQSLRDISLELDLPIMEVGTLEFFDFNVNLLPDNFIYDVVY